MFEQLINDLGKVYIQITYDSANDWVLNSWFSSQTLNSVTSGANTSLQTLLVHDCPYLLNDDRRVVGSWNHSIKWVISDWMPRAIEQGVTHIAHLSNHNLPATNSTETQHPGLIGQLHVRHFQEADSAKDWLHEAQRAACLPPE